MQSLQSAISQRQLASPKHKNLKDQIFLGINIFINQQDVVWQRLNLKSQTAFFMSCPFTVTKLCKCVN